MNLLPDLSTFRTAFIIYELYLFFKCSSKADVEKIFELYDDNSSKNSRKHILEILTNWLMNILPIA